MTAGLSNIERLYRYALAILLLIILISGCEMQLKKQAVEAYNIHLESSEQVRDVVSVATEFAEQFDAEVHGGVRDRAGASRQVLELHFPSGVQINLSNFIDEMLFIVAIYSGDGPGYSQISDNLMEAMKSAGMRVEVRNVSE